MLGSDSDKVAIGETNNDAGVQMDSFTQNSDIAETDATVELRANLVAGDRSLTETWVYQWLKE